MPTSETASTSSGDPEAAALPRDSADYALLASIQTRAREQPDYQISLAAAKTKIATRESGDYSPMSATETLTKQREQPDFSFTSTAPIAIPRL